MSFRKMNNENDRWARFLTSHSLSVEALSSLQHELATPSKFEHLLQLGDGQLTALSDAEWAHLNTIVNRFEEDWQSWFTREMYPAIYRQRDRRDWLPAELPLSREDFSGEALFIHLWTPWNLYSRGFDENVQIVARKFSDRVAFRSFNVDSPDLYDFVLGLDRL